MRFISVVQPEVVSGAGQALRELNLVAHIPAGYCRVRWRRSKRWVIVESVKGVGLSRVARNLNHKVSAFCQLEIEREEKIEN